MPSNAKIYCLTVQKDPLATLDIIQGHHFMARCWFLGHNPKDVTVKMPTKKPKDIVKERFRCRKFGFDDLVMLIACGLHNFRITISLNLKHIEFYPI